MKPNMKDPLLALAGTIVSQGGVFLCIVMIGYFAGPRSLGKFNYLLSLGMFLGTVAGLRYDLACVSTNPTKSYNGILHVLVLGAVICTISAMVFSALGLAPYMTFFFAFGILAQQLLANYYNSHRQFHLVNLPRTIASMLFLIGVIPMVLASVKDGQAFFLAYTASTVVATAAFVISNARRERTAFYFDPGFYRDHARYPMFTLPSTLCNAVFNYALPIVFPLWFGAENAGYFAVAYRFGFFPVNLCAQSLAGIVRRDSLTALESEDGPRRLNAYVRGNFFLLAGLAIGYTVAMLAACAAAQVLLAGSKWSASADLLLCMLPMFVGQLVFMPMSQTFLVTRAQFADFMVQFVNGVGLLGVLAVSRTMHLSATQSTLAFSMVGSVILLGGSMVILRTVSRFTSRLAIPAPREECQA